MIQEGASWPNTLRREKKGTRRILPRSDRLMIVIRSVISVIRLASVLTLSPIVVRRPAGGNVSSSHPQNLIITSMAGQILLLGRRERQRIDKAQSLDQTPCQFQGLKIVLQRVMSPIMLRLWLPRWIWIITMRRVSSWRYAWADLRRDWVSGRATRGQHLFSDVTLRLFWQ